MNPDNYLLLWTEIYNGVPGQPKTKCAASGWCYLPKTGTLLEAVQRVSKHFHKNGYPVSKYCILSYPLWQTNGWKTTDRILKVFG